MRKTLAIVIQLIIALSFQIAAQNIEDNQEVVGLQDISFEGLSPQHLKFNVLRDRGAELEDFDVYTGLTTLNDNNYCTRDVFANLLRSVKSMSASTSWNAESILLEQDNLGSTSKAVISVLFYQYLYIKENALRDNLIKFENGVVSDNEINGVWQDPYDTGYVLAFAPQDTVFENSVTFSFPKWILNYGASKYEFDPGDGAGYRTVKSGSTLSVNYTNDGVHELKLRAVASSGTHVAHAKIRTYTPNSSGLGRSNSYSSIFTSEYVSTNYNGSVVEGILSRSKSGHGKQPFIYVEGFDIDLFGNKSLEENPGGYGIQGPMTLIDGGIDPLLVTNYDFYYLDFKDGTCSNKAKAALLEKVITQINDSKTKEITNIIFGSSMGGLTARYCLANMERRGEKHQTSILLCQDTPNQGANVPLGALYAIHELIKIYNRYAGNNSEINDGIGYLQRIIHSTAAKEILYNYVTPQGTLNNTVHDSFMAELQELGYPKGDNGTLRCLAISNGNDFISLADHPLLSFDAKFSITAFSNVFYPILSPIFGTAVGIIFKNLKAALSSLLIGGSKLTLTTSLYASGATHPLFDFRLTYVKKLLWLVNVKTTLYHTSKPQLSNSIHYDLSRGSYYSLKNFIASFDTYEVSGPRGFFGTFIKYGGNLTVVDKILFIPTVSALDLGEGKASLTNSDYQQVITMDSRPSKPKHSPFHAYYIPKQSEAHIHLSAEARKWIEGQLNTFVDGNPVAKNGDKYMLNNNVNNLAVTWSTSDESVATINQNGILTAKKHGYIDVLATLSNGQVYRKNIMVGLPSYTIRVNPQSNYHVLSPVISSTEPSDYKRFSDFVDFEVAIKSVNNNLTWEECLQKSYTVFIDDSNSNKTQTVYFRPTYKSNDFKYTGEPIYTTVCTLSPYVLEPNYIKYKDGVFLNTVTVKKNPNYTGSFPEVYKIYHIRNAGSSSITGLRGTTSIVLSASHIFPTSMRESMSNSGVTSISQSFELLGQTGNTIQTFNVSAIKSNL